MLLLLFLLCRNTPVADDIVLETFWPGDESKARASLRTTLSIVRKYLCPEGELDPIVRQAGGILIKTEIPIWFDYREFCQQIEQGKAIEADRPEKAMENYRASVRLYRGHFLENFYEDWALLVREESELSYAFALRRLASARLVGQQWAEAHEYAYCGLRNDPLSSKFCEMTMEALIGMKRHQDAIKVFEECRATLESELGVEPTIEMLRFCELAKIGM